MDDNEETFPSLPTNYITIVDLQKRWIEQQQNNKLLKNECKSDNPEEHIIVSNPNSKFQKPNHLNPISKNNKVSSYNFKGRKPQQSGVSGEPKDKDENKTKKKNKWKNKKNNKMKKGDDDDDDKGKWKVIEEDDHDQKVVIKTNFKEESGNKWMGSRSTADFRGTQRVYGGYKRFNHREAEKEQPKESHLVCLCVEERENDSEGKSSRGAVREEIQLHGGNKVSVDEIESKLKEVRVTVSGNNWRPRPKKGVDNINTNKRGFDLKKRQFEQKSVDAVPVPVPEGSKVHGGDGKGFEVKGEVGCLENEGRVDDPNGKSMQGDVNRGFRKHWGEPGRGRGRGSGFRYGRSRAVVGPRILNGGSRDWVWVKRCDLNLNS